MERIRLPKIPSAFAPAFCPLNRNVLNSPLARHGRTQLQWRRGSRSHDWYHLLDESVRLRLPADTDEYWRRCPTSFDLNILLWLLALARINSSASSVEVEPTQLLKGLGYDPQTETRRMLDEALDLWSFIVIEYDSWHYTGEEKPRRRRLPPPILRREGRSVEIDHEWRDLSYTFFERVPLPLPRSAAAQNIVLLLLARYVSKDDGKMEVKRINVAELYWKIGLHHNTASRSLKHAVEEAKSWFKEHGGELEGEVMFGTVSFVFKRPQLDGPPRKQQEQIVPDYGYRDVKPKPREAPAPARRVPAQQQYPAPTHAYSERGDDIVPLTREERAELAQHTGKTRILNDAGEPVYLDDEEAEALIERRMANRR